MNSLLQIKAKRSCSRREKSDPERIESDEIRDFQNPDAGVNWYGGMGV